MKFVATALSVALLAAQDTIAQPKNNDSATAITIYSTAAPGAVSPDQYRGRGGQAPGYALVRQERPVALDKGKMTVRF
ncbi:MAG TPA: hypothetical protein VFH31_01130, partial [Pyrinomonadaceae bacterium]|nr:hypothetical protein [Pyrinomonadaceae bacterium]